MLLMILLLMLMFLLLMLLLMLLMLLLLLMFLLLKNAAVDATAVSDPDADLVDNAADAGGSFAAAVENT